VTEDEARDRVDAIARTWIKTPFHDHARVKGAGADCATFLLCVFEEAGLIPHTDVGYYSPQFFYHSSEERYVAWVEKFAGEIPADRVKPGDIVLYKPHGALCFCHGALVVKPGWPAIIHAHFHRRKVCPGNGRSPHLGRTIAAMKFFSLFHSGALAPSTSPLARREG
jgi:cell wall-associated NlpC family hydrolase